MKMFSWHNNKPSVVQPINQATQLQLDAAVLVCDTFLVFASDTAAYQWADHILHEINPAFQLTTKAKVEAIVGYKGNPSDLHTNMQDLIHLTLNRMGFPPKEYRINFLETKTKLPPMHIWCALAVRQQPTE